MTLWNHEPDDVLTLLAEQRAMLLVTLRDVDDAQAARCTTVSELTLGGIVKHLTAGERSWSALLRARDGHLPEGMIDPEQYRMHPTDTIGRLLRDYRAAARTTDDAVLSLPDLDVRVPLPAFPWGPPDPVSWSARRVLLQLLRETAQHAGHADIIREALDGASTTARLATIATVSPN